ncbi:hypothetical protein [Undibacterium sp.]|uniref:hypothetical protein n=1 Tax=Undibacterium sp. TaxID=1914977 RepID=UPI002D0C3A9F|nr:hypothetical protein [Undibacterium sp.]HTD06386.1 hypothetical protein [Undibacterium sp.]
MSSATIYPVIDPVVLLRVRNHIIEYLEVAASFDEQREYQRKSPGVNVPAEVLHQWEDWLTEDWQQRYTGPAFSDAERLAMLKYQQIIAPLADGALEPLPALEHLHAMPQWLGLRAAATEILAVFMLRGKLPERAQAT